VSAAGVNASKATDIAYAGGATVSGTPNVALPPTTIPTSTGTATFNLPNGAFGPVSLTAQPTNCSDPLLPSGYVCDAASQTVTLDLVSTQGSTHLYSASAPASLSLTCSDAACPKPASPSPAPTAGSVASGWSHTCALRPDHTIQCWGDNVDGQDGLEGVLQVSLAEANGGYGVNSGGVILNQNNASSGKPPKDGYMQCLGLMVIRGGLSAIGGRLLYKGKDVSSWASATVPVSSNPARVPNLVIPPPQGEGVMPRPSGAGNWQRGESQLQMFARMRTRTAQWLSLPPQIRKAYQHGILTDAALPLVPVESPGGFWLLRGLEAQEPPIETPWGAGKIVSRACVTKK
jgi:hypothetical protein